MLLKEIAASLYPWDLADEGAGRIAGELSERCRVNSLYLVGVMHHEKRPLTSLFFTHNPRRKFYLPENSRVYYRLNEDDFRDTRLKPLYSEQEFLKKTDWLKELASEARRRGMRVGVELSHTLYDTDRALEQFPEMMQRDVYGQVIGGFLGMLCPNHPEVREYQLAMFASTVREHDIDFLQTCLITFAAGRKAEAPWFFRDWMDIKNPGLGELLGLSRGGCFCESCRQRAKEMGYDWQRILHDMRALRRIADATALQNQEELMENHLMLGSQMTEAELLIEYPGLMDFLRFRMDCVTELFREIHERIKGVRPGVEIRYNNFVRYPGHVGLCYRRVAPYLDSVRDCEYSEQYGAPDGFAFKRQSLLNLRRGIGFDKGLIAGIAVRPNADAQTIERSVQVLTELGIDGISLGHYDCAHLEHLDAFGAALQKAHIRLC